MVDLSRVRAAEVQATAGSAGRTALASPSLSGLSNLAALVKDYKTDSAAAAKVAAGQAEDAATNDFAQREAEVNIASFSADKDAPLLKAFGFDTTPGPDEEITKEEMGALARYQSRRQSLEAVAPQLRDRARIDIAQESLRVELLQKYPTLKATLFKAQNPELASRARDLADEDAKIEREKEKKFTDLQDEIGYAQKGTDYFKLSPAGRAKVVNAVQRDATRYKTAQENAAILASDETQSEVSRRNNLRQNAGSISDVAAVNLYTTFQTLLDKGFSADEIAKQGAVLEARARQELSRLMGGATPQEVQTQFGWLLDTFKETRGKLASGAYTKEAATTANQILIETAKSGVLTSTPGASFAAALGEILPPEALRYLEQSTTIKGIWATVAQGAARNLGLDSSGDPVLTDILDGEGVNADMGQVREGAKRYGTGAADFWKSPLASNAQAARGAVVGTLSYLASPAVARDSSQDLVRTQLGAISNPKFREALEGQTVPQAATDSVDRFVVSASRLLSQKVQADKGKLTASVATDGKIVLKVDPSLSPTKRREAQRLVGELNEAVRGRAHLANTEDYRAYVLEYLAVPEFGQALLDLGAVQEQPEQADEVVDVIEGPDGQLYRKVS